MACFVDCYAGLRSLLRKPFARLVFFMASVPLALYAASPTLTIDLKDFATVPITGKVDGQRNDAYLSRVQIMREEGGRFFVADANGPLYILDSRTKAFTTFLNFNGDTGGLFHKLFTGSGFTDGFVNFVFDPDFMHNGKFYTIHIENPTLPGSVMPDNTNVPGLNLSGYAVTPVISTPGPARLEAVLIEWTDASPSSSIFKGTARELMRLQLNSPSHPMAGLIFDPTAQPGSANWRVLYISIGDGAAGESPNLAIRPNAQRLDTLVGKVLRIIPDLNEHTGSSIVSENGKYRIPDDNPFFFVPDARKEIWAYGFRNIERLSWYSDATNPSKNRLIGDSIGLHTWESVEIIHKGINYGYDLREGNQQLAPDNTLNPIPAVDKIPVLLNATTSLGMVTPTYPVAEYGHDPSGGDAISNGYVYQGKIAALRGKYIFGDITTGHVWYLDYDDMLALDDANPRDPSNMATMHVVHILWGGEEYSSMHPIVEAGYHARGGKAPVLPGRGAVSGPRADIKFSEDANNNLYITSKSDGMIREIVGATLK